MSAGKKATGTCGTAFLHDDSQREVVSRRGLVPACGVLDTSSVSAAYGERKGLTVQGPSRLSFRLGGVSSGFFKNRNWSFQPECSASAGSVSCCAGNSKGHQWRSRCSRCTRRRASRMSGRNCASTEGGATPTLCLFTGRAWTRCRGTWRSCWNTASACLWGQFVVSLTLGDSDDARCECLIGVCRALCYLHTRPACIAHGDLKPSNVLVGSPTRTTFGLSLFHRTQSKSETARRHHPVVCAGGVQ